MFRLHSGFSRQYRCFSVSFLVGRNSEDIENGGKIIMPPSALQVLSESNIQYPMLFKLTNGAVGKSSHCGVLEFVADEGKIYMPYWMMTNLLLEEGAIVDLESISLPVAEYVKIQPQSVDFLDISNPKAVLERALRTFACLTVGDIIAIYYNNKRYEFNIMELRPQNAVSIIECDMNVEFAFPVGYTEPGKVMEDEAADPSVHLPPTAFEVFGCKGNRLDGKQKKKSLNASNLPPPQHKRGVPNYDYKPGNIRFFRSKRANPEEKKEEETFSAFQGRGALIRPKKNIC